MLRKFTIDSHGAVTAEAARLKAKQTISDLAIDKNPTEVQEEVRNLVTVRSLGERFIEEYVPCHLTTST